MLTQLYSKLYDWLRGLWDSELVLLAIVRRYADANGHYVGELYMYGTFTGIGCYRMIGCSLDSFPLDMCGLSFADQPNMLDLAHDFIAPMLPDTMRVGALEPSGNDAVRKMIGKFRRANIRLVIQNRFIEHVLDGVHK